VSSNRALLDSPPRVTARHVVAWLALVSLAAVLSWLWWPGWRTYPEATSRESLTQIKALYSACSARNPEWLGRVEQAVAQAADDGHLSAGEQQAFQRILATAKAGEWSAAQAASLQFAEDQVRR
jgi:hypothetical protein